MSHSSEGAKRLPQRPRDHRFIHFWARSFDYA